MQAPCVGVELTKPGIGVCVGVIRGEHLLQHRLGLGDLAELMQRAGDAALIGRLAGPAGRCLAIRRQRALDPSLLDIDMAELVSGFGQPVLLRIEDRLQRCSRLVELAEPAADDAELLAVAQIVGFARQRLLVGRARVMPLARGKVEIAEPPEQTGFVVPFGAGSFELVERCRHETFGGEGVGQHHAQWRGQRAAACEQSLEAFGRLSIDQAARGQVHRAAGQQPAQHRLAVGAEAIGEDDGIVPGTPKDRRRPLIWWCTGQHQRLPERAQRGMAERQQLALGVEGQDARADQQLHRGRRVTRLAGCDRSAALGQAEVVALVLIQQCCDRGQRLDRMLQGRRVRVRFQRRCDHRRQPCRQQPTAAVGWLGGKRDQCRQPARSRGKADHVAGALEPGCQIVAALPLDGADHVAWQQWPDAAHFGRAEPRAEQR